MQVRDFKGALLGHKIFAPPSGPEWDCIDAHLTPDGRYALVREFARKRGGHGLKDVERIAVYSIPGFEPVSEVLGQKMVWPVISPDGRLFVTLIREHDSKGLMVYALPGLKRVGFAPYPASLPLAFSPDGRYLAIAREPQESPGMKILDAERHWAVVFSTTAAVNGAVFSPDGRALLTTEREPHESPLTQIFRLWDFSP